MPKRKPAPKKNAPTLEARIAALEKKVDWNRSDWQWDKFAKSGLFWRIGYRLKRLEKSTKLGPVDFDKLLKAHPKTLSEWKKKKKPLPKR